MRILGIDPGLHATGYGVITVSSEGLRLVAAGTIHPSSPRVALGRRLQELYDGLREVIATSQPQALALESVYTHHEYLTTAALMAHARGVICLLGTQQGMSLIEYLPTRVKKALTGRGHASKEQVSRAVGMWLNVDASAWDSDVTDALALAVAHAQIGRVQAAIPVLASGRAHRSRRAAFSTVGG